MRDLFEAPRLQQYAAEEYADGRERRDGPHARHLLDYIEFSFSYGAKLSAEGRRLMGISEADQLFA